MNKRLIDSSIKYCENRKYVLEPKTRKRVTPTLGPYDVLQLAYSISDRGCVIIIDTYSEIIIGYYTNGHVKYNYGDKLYRT